MLSKDFKEIFTAEMISITGGVLAGSMLAFYVDEIILIPGLMILFPGYLEMRNAISGSMVARLGSALHLGTTTPYVKGNKFAAENIAAVFILSLVVAFVLAAIAYSATYFIFHQSTLKIFLIALIAVVISNLIENLISLYTTFWLFRKGHDPNNIMGPYITTVGDIISVGGLVIATTVVLWL